MVDRFPHERTLLAPRPAGGAGALETAEKPSRGPLGAPRRRGRAARALAGWSAAALLVLALPWILRRAASAPAAAVPPSAAGAGPSGPAAGSEPAAAEFGPRDPALDADRTESASPLELPSGPGGLRGAVDAAPGLAFPSRWTLVLEPSRAFAGAGSAAWRRVEFERGERDFEVGGLPFGGYDVRPEAEGMNGTSVSVSIDRRNTSPYVQLELTAAGLLDGSVRGAAGEPIEGLAVVLESSPDRRRSATATDASGFYRFERVVDGEYALYFGSPEAPLARPLSISFRAPSLRVPEQVFDSLGALAITVLDDRDLPVQAAEVHGTGTRGGRVSGATDATGKLEARLLPEGRWRLRAECPGLGSGFAVAELKRGQRQAVEIRLAR